MVQEVRFYSEGDIIAGHLYLPKSISLPSPGIVLCHGFAGIKELLLPAFADYFCDKGYAVLAFDYRGFGASSGEPGRLVPADQIRDIRNAVTFLQTNASVDPHRIGLWGTSFGGGNAIIAGSMDSRVKCLCVQVAFGDGARVITGNLAPEEKSRLSAAVQKMKEKKVLTGKEMLVPLNKILSDPQSKAFFEGHIAQFPQLNIKIPFLTLAETLDHAPEKFLKYLHIPIQIIAAENDGVNSPEESQLLFAAALEPKELFVVQGATHYEMYEGPYFEQVAGRQSAWFDRFL
jgi:uncharacterized protein